MTVCCVNQILGGGRYPHENCGQACVVSIKSDAGYADTDRLEEEFDLLHDDNPDDGTGGDVHVLSLATVGIPAHVDNTHNTGEVLTHARLSGLNRVMIAIDSDHAGYPSPGSGIGHWILWVGDENYMQPVGGSLRYYPDDIVEAASQNYHVVVDRAIGSAAGGNPMTPDERLDVGRAITRLAYVCIARRQPESQTAEDSWASQMRDQGFDKIMGPLTDALVRERDHVR